MATHSSAMTAMVVVNEQGFGDFLELLLAEEGCSTVRYFRMADEGPEESSSIDFAVIDFDSISQECKSIDVWARANQRVPIIMLAWEEESLRQLGTIPFEFLRKPFDIDVFSEVVRRLTQGQDSIPS